MRIRGDITGAVNASKIHHPSVDFVGGIDALIAAEELRIGAITAILDSAADFDNHETNPIIFRGAIVGSLGGLVVNERALDTLDGGSNSSTSGGGGGGGGGGITFTSSEFAPPSPAEGDEWYQSTTARKFTWVLNDDDAGQWVELEALDGGGSRGIKFFSQAVAPDDAIPGDRWFDISSGIEYTLIDDGSSVQWVEHF